VNEKKVNIFKYFLFLFFDAARLVKDAARLVHMGRDARLYIWAGMRGCRLCGG
jgi:hypothetical protein